ncbi:MAG TPA: acetylglutamate kinase [Pseudogracilibacillus sp.]|nr:acetylglutamate kinase [Pseudogracilibacillus sp.]
MQDIIVFKCGGSAVNDLSADFYENLKRLQQAGMHPVVVHGGGPDIEKMLDKLNIQYEFIDGLRKTTDEMMDVVEMVLTGHVNPQLIKHFHQHGLKAMGLAGTAFLEATPMNEARLGQVGEIKYVETTFIHDLLKQGIIPVISPVALGNNQKRYNVNADTAAGAVASAIDAKQLIFVTDVPGILKENELVEKVSLTEVHQLLEDGTIYGGMIPKVKAATKGLQGSIQEVMIVDGKHSQLKTETSLIGTTITTNIQSNVGI